SGSTLLYNVVVRLAGLFFDRVFGLFVFAPLWFLSVPAFFTLLRRNRGEALRVAALVWSIVGIAAAFNYWAAGLSVPARYCLPIIPALALALSTALPERASLVGGLGALQFGLVLLAFRTPSMFHVLLGGESPLLRSLSPSLDLG